MTRPIPPRFLLRLRLPRRRSAVAVFLLAAGLPLAAFADVRLDAGGGAFVPFGDEHRQVYGASPSFDLGVSSALGDNGARLFLEISHVRASGDELTPDPTFEGLGEAEYRLWPVSLGARFDLNRVPDQDLRLFLGIGFQTLFSRWEGLGTDGTSPAFGAFLEWRPEYRVSKRWSIWARQRLAVVSDTDYGPGAVILNHSGTTIGLGVSYGLDDAPLTPPRAEP